jgi:hypothetical protein
MAQGVSAASRPSVQQLISLYQQAIEYYSAVNDDKHLNYF